MKHRAYVMSDRRAPWATSYFVMRGSRIIAKGLTWQAAMTIARAVAH